ncbi:sensor histidine kinase [Staphylospora marina]|uniref:sensor histidine kinase n=1 Tax=Staphylospora marina TaxID=2490858 RepID=UPI0013DE1E23|nr:ATP-binding protein [Staphylospora marina]
MLDLQDTYRIGPLYRVISELFLQNPYVAWICVGAVTAGLTVLLFLGQNRISRLPAYGYTVAVLVFVSLLDVFTQTIPVLPVYLFMLGYVLFRSGEESSRLIALLFSSVYVAVSVLTVWNRWVLVELAGHVLLFFGITWMSNQIQSDHFNIRKLQEKNRLIINQKNEAYRRLRNYMMEMEEVYLRDNLTGLYNFGAFRAEVVRGLARCLPGQSYHVVCLDLKDFRQVNFREGVEVGDRILVHIARKLKKQLPASVKIARYDGDQFGIGFTGDSRMLRQVLDTVDRLMADMKQELAYLGYAVGTASYPEETVSGADLIRLAEERLAIKQRLHRNREEEHRRHLEKLSALGQLAAGLAHEIRNPLTSIRGFVQLSAKESEAVKKWETIILEEIDRINDLLKEFLNLREARPMQVTRFDVGQLIQDVLRLLGPKALLMGHTLTGEGPDAELELEADSEQLKQVLINLVQNGLEALDEKGSVRVTWQGSGDWVIIRVEDNGNGIKPENMNRIFEPFFTTKGEGTGMGLAICHRIITEHGGQIFFTSQPGQGTVFHIHLPVRQVRLRVVEGGSGKKSEASVGESRSKNRETDDVKAFATAVRGAVQ